MIMKKGFKYIGTAVVIVIALYHSVYFQPLDEKLAAGKEMVFKANDFVDEIWDEGLKNAYNSAIEFSELFDQLRRDPELAFRDHANALAVGNIGYFRVKGEGVVREINTNNVILVIGSQEIEVETEFIFGNAVRDASGLIKVNDFERISDLNSISEAINDKIRREILPAFRGNVEVGDRVIFEGAMELNQAHLDLHLPEIIPINLTKI